MNWLVLILAFCAALLAGGYLAGRLERSRSGWSVRRRRWTAALALPAFIALLTLVGIAWVFLSGPGQGENMQDLALVVTAGVGGIFAAVALLGGLVGASFATRSSRE